jgi:hypothetical protein
LLKAIIHNYFITLSFLVILASLYRYSKYFDSKLKYFPILLMYIFLTELLGLIIKFDPEKNPFFTNLYSKYNFLIYNIYDILFFGYFFYLYWHYCNSKKIIFIGSLIYIFSFIINLSFTNIIIYPLIFSYTIGGIILIISASMHLKENIKKSLLKKNILFWISLGLIIFHIGFIPINILYTLKSNELNFFLYKIHLALVVLMYSCFVYGFIQMKGKLKV